MASRSKESAKAKPKESAAASIKGYTNAVNALAKVKSSSVSRDKNAASSSGTRKWHDEKQSAESELKKRKEEVLRIREITLSSKDKKLIDAIAKIGADEGHKISVRALKSLKGHVKDAIRDQCGHVNVTFIKED